MIVIILPHAFFLNPAAPFSVEKRGSSRSGKEAGRFLRPPKKRSRTCNLPAECYCYFRETGCGVADEQSFENTGAGSGAVRFSAGGGTGAAAGGKVYLPDLVHETQLNFSPPGGNHIAIGWWIPQEYWINIFRNTTGSDPQSIDTALKLLRNYALLAVFQCDNERGNYRFYQQQQIASGLQVFYQPEEGRRERLRPVQDLPADLEVLIASITPLLTNVMGNMGRNFTFFVFQDLDVNGKRTVDPYLPGSLEIQLRQKNNKVLKKQLDFPLNSLFLPRLCPNGVPADASWKFCPWTGIRLPE